MKYLAVLFCLVSGSAMADQIFGNASANDAWWTNRLNWLSNYSVITSNNLSSISNYSLSISNMANDIRNYALSISNIVNTGTNSTAMVSNIVGAATNMITAATNNTASLSNALTTVASYATTNSTFTFTNFPLNTVVTNTSGRTWVYSGVARIATTNNIGRAELSIYNDWNGLNSFTNVVTCRQSATNGGMFFTNLVPFLIVIPNNSKSFATNASIGTGNSGSIVQGVLERR